MTHSLLYPPASRAQWYSGGQYGGSTMSLAAPVVVLHTTEGGGWPAYSGGAVAPTLTYDPTSRQWRQHFPLNESARALMNLPGGVQTNTAGAIQVELIGTCDRPTKARIPSLVYWPEAPDTALQDVADFLAFCNREVGLPLVSTPRPWLPYPSSYGNSAARMTFPEWDAFSGVCGHQHVPENDHGDPGNLNIARVLQLTHGPAVAPGKTPSTTGLPVTLPDIPKETVVTFLKFGNTTFVQLGDRLLGIPDAAHLASLQKWAAYRAGGKLDGFTEQDGLNVAAVLR